MQALKPGDPQQISAYRILGRLGAGGMGVVFLAQTGRGGPVAIKTLAAGSDPSFRARFEREVEAALRVSSMFTARVLDADTEADPPYLVTEYVAGETLRDHIDRLGPLGPDLVIAAAGGLAAGLHAIHQAGVTHRDLSATNIMLTDDGPRIIDLGIASVEEATRLTQTGTTLGTPGFMSPEHARGEPVGPAADIFAWGSLVTFAATGAPPFGTGRAEQVLYRIVHERPLLTGLPDPLVPDVTAALSKKPDARPTATDLVNRLCERLFEQNPPYMPDEAELSQAITEQWHATGRRIVRPIPPDDSSATAELNQGGGTRQVENSQTGTDQETVALGPKPRRSLTAPIVAAAAVLLIGAGAYNLWPRGSAEQFDDREASATSTESSNSSVQATTDSAQEREEPEPSTSDEEPEPEPESEPEPEVVVRQQGSLLPDNHAERGRRTVQVDGRDAVLIISENQDYSEAVDDRVTATLALVADEDLQLLEQQQMQDCRYLDRLDHFEDGTTEVLCHWGASAGWLFAVSVESGSLRIEELWSG